jgi:hypothetical protein
MGIPLDASTPAGRVIDEYQASLKAEETFVKLALGAMGVALAIGAIIVTGGAAAPGVAGALATAETASALALASAGLGAYSAIEEYAEYRFGHAAAGSSLDPATALSRDDPSLAWLALAVVGAVVDVGAAVVAFKNLAAVSRAAHTAEGMLALEEAARAQARVLRREGRLGAMTEQEFVDRIKAARAGVRVASGLGPSGPMKLVRYIERGEKLEEIINEGKALTYMTGNEHALVKLKDGRRAIVSGGPGGIDFEEGAVLRIYGHTHPTSAPHSEADVRALEELGQSQQTVLHGGQRTKVRPRRFREDPEALPRSEAMSRPRELTEEEKWEQAARALEEQEGRPPGVGETPPKDPKAETPQKTAAEQDWEKAEAQAREQEALADRPTRTEHGAIREQGRGALTAQERAKLPGSLAHTQSDGATARVLSEGRGSYTVVITGDEGVLITVIRGKTRAEVRGLSSRYGWDPPW